MVINYGRFLSIKFIALFLFFPLLAEEDWQFYERKGKIQFEEGLYNFSEESLTKAVRLNADAYQSIALLGMLELQNNRKNEALALFRRSLAIKPDQEMILVRAGIIEDFYGNLINADSFFQQALAINPDNITALAGRARISFLQKRPNDGGQYLMKINFLKSSVSDALRRKSRNYLIEKKPLRAIASLEEAIKENPADENCYYELETIYRSRNDFRGALTVLEKLKYINPANPSSYIHIANIYYAGRTSPKRNMEIEIGIQNIRQAIEIDPLNAESYSLLSSFYRLKGMNDEALAAENKYFELEKQNAKEE